MAPVSDALMAAPALIVVAMVLVARGRSVLGAHGIVFLALALVPVIVYSRGGEIYQGIVVDRIPTATQGFTFATLGLLLASLLVPQRRYLASYVDPSNPRRFELPLVLLLTATSGYALLGAVRVLDAGVQGDKLASIEAAGPFHYDFLFVAICVLAAWPLARPSLAARRCYWMFLIVYMGYCYLTQERDFVFVVLGLAVLGVLTQPGTRLLRLAALGYAAVFAVTALATGRTAKEQEVSAVAQGPILFVDTRILEYVPATTPRAGGSTYLDAATSALTRGRVGGETSPTEWLVDQYAPGSESGYGFSMTGEAILNFGQTGVLPVFLAIGLAVNYLVNRADRTAFHAHLAYFAVMFVPYMFRADSRGLLAGTSLCVLIHLALVVASRPPREHPLERSPHAVARHI